MRAQSRHPKAELLGLMLGALVGLTGLALAGERPLLVKAPAGDPAQFMHLFDISGNCLACHNNLRDRSGADVSIGTDWRSTMMANSARDPYWQAGVRRETLDHPKAVAAIEAECSICHMPMARNLAHAAGGQGTIFEHLPIGLSQAPLAALAADGVSCTLCHQIQADHLGEEASMVGRFVIDHKAPQEKRQIFGPFEVDAGRTRLMQSASVFSPQKAAHIRAAGLCGSCHTLITHSLGPNGQVVGELPEQVPYQEWLHSAYPERQTCQDCHMQAIAGPVDISSVRGQPREGAMRHIFRGGNFVIPRLLNAHRKELGATASSKELAATAEGALRNLREDTARLQLGSLRRTETSLEVTAVVANLAGHKLPTAYPSRRVWIHLRVSDAAGQVVFESGAMRPDGAIVGNDNDLDPKKYEPHHQRISGADQVQIYEPILGGPDGQVTTGLLTATRYLKDNRILPEGFDKAKAGPRIAVHGAAEQDPDFAAGGDRVVYDIPLAGRAAGDLTIEATLRYQPIGHRWAMNLADYKSVEPQRFVGYFKAAAQDSSAVLATAHARLSSTPTLPPAPEAQAQPAPAP